MSTKPSIGDQPAFPPSFNRFDVATHGMNYRQWLIGQVLAASCEDPDMVIVVVDEVISLLDAEREAK